MKNTHSSTRRTLLSLTGLAAFLLPAVFSRNAKATSRDKAVIKQPSSASDQAFINRAFDMRDEAANIGDQAYG